MVSSQNASFCLWSSMQIYMWNKISMSTKTWKDVKTLPKISRSPTIFDTWRIPAAGYAPALPSFTEFYRVLPDKSWDFLIQSATYWFPYVQSISIYFNLFQSEMYSEILMLQPSTWWRLGAGWQGSWFGAEVQGVWIQGMLRDHLWISDVGSNSTRQVSGL
jgi:hypothetical protein